MSSQLQYQMARARQQEIASRAIHAHHQSDARATGGGRQPVGRRLGQAIGGLGVCLAASIALTVSGAHANPPAAKQGGKHISAQQLARETRALEAKGYTPVACTVNGTLMRNYRTGRSVTIEW
jgi:hypothetical protein